MMNLGNEQEEKEKIKRMDSMGIKKLLSIKT